MSNLLSAIFGDVFAESSFSDQEDADSDGEENSDSSDELVRYTRHDWTVKRSVGTPDARPVDRLFVVGMPSSQRFDRYVCSSNCHVMRALQRLCLFEEGGPLHTLHTEQDALYMLCEDPQMLALIAKSCISDSTATPPPPPPDVSGVRVVMPDPGRDTAHHNRFAEALPLTQAKILNRTHQGTSLDAVVGAHVTHSHAPEKRRNVMRHESSSSEYGDDDDDDEESSDRDAVGVLSAAFLGRGNGRSSSSSSSSSSESGASSYEDSRAVAFNGRRRKQRGYASQRSRKSTRSAQNAPLRNVRSFKRGVLELYAEAHQCHIDRAKAWFSESFEKNEWFYVNAVAATLIHHYHASQPAADS